VTVPLGAIPSPPNLLQSAASMSSNPLSSFCFRALAPFRKPDILYRYRTAPDTGPRPLARWPLMLARGVRLDIAAPAFLGCGNARVHGSDRNGPNGHSPKPPHRRLGSGGGGNASFTQPDPPCKRDGRHATSSHSVTDCTSPRLRPGRCSGPRPALNPSLLCLILYL